MKSKAAWGVDGSGDSRRYLTRFYEAGDSSGGRWEWNGQWTILAVSCLTVKSVQCQNKHAITLNVVILKISQCHERIGKWKWHLKLRLNIVQPGSTKGHKDRIYHSCKNAFKKYFGRKIFDSLKFAFKNRCSVSMVPVHIASKPHAKLRMLHSETSVIYISTINCTDLLGYLMNTRRCQKQTVFINSDWGFTNDEAWPTDLKYTKILKKIIVWPCLPARFYGNKPNSRSLFVSRKVLMVETWFWAQNVQKVWFSMYC